MNLIVQMTHLSKHLHHYPPLDSSLTFTEEEVYNELKELNPVKTCDPDGVLFRAGAS